MRRESSSTEKLWEGAEKEDERKKVGFKLVLKVEEETGKKESDPLSTIPLFPFIPMYPACSPKAKASVTLYCHQRTELSLLGALMAIRRQRTKHLCSHGIWCFTALALD